MRCFMGSIVEENRVVRLCYKFMHLTLAVFDLQWKRKNQHIAKECGEELQVSDNIQLLFLSNPSFK